MLNIVVPMAGRGSRFAISGYNDPKPLISFGGKPMIQWVVENIRPECEHRFIFICLAEHLDKYPRVEFTLRELCPNCLIITLAKVTEGAACTVLLAKHIINTKDPLMIANADQFVELDINRYIERMEDENADGIIMSFLSSHPKWSYCRMNIDGTVKEVVEKQVVSNQATVGIYNFRRGSDFVGAAENMIRHNLRVNNEFYVAPTYNQLINNGLKIVTCGTGTEYAGMFGLGVPLDLEFFKTTNHYVLGSSLNIEHKQLNCERLKYFTRITRAFIGENNFAGLTALLLDDVCLELGNGDQIIGRDLVLDYFLGNKLESNVQQEPNVVRGPLVVSRGLGDPDTFKNCSRILATVIELFENRVKTIRDQG
jgi:dTDP-glucose pyrophosphorylase